MASDAEKKARKEVRRAQADFERKQAASDKAAAARRASFERARATGLSLRDIAEETGLHWTRIGEILRRR